MQEGLSSNKCHTEKLICNKIVNGLVGMFCFIFKDNGTSGIIWFPVS